MSTASNVIIYSAPWCAFCHAAKKYLDTLNVAYQELDVEADPKNGEASLEKSKQRGIPVLDIGGDIIVGFDRPKIDSALKAHGLIT